MAGLLICAGQMAIGRKNRSTFAADGATGVPWVLRGLSLAVTASSIVGVFFRMRIPRRRSNLRLLAAGVIASGTLLYISPDHDGSHSRAAVLPLRLSRCRRRR